MTVNLRFDIAYDGTDFHGWASQRDGLRTVQSTLEEVVRLVLRLDESYTLTVAGRTDAGVHATGQVANMVVPASSLEQRSIDGDPGRLTSRLNKLLPADVSLLRVSAVPNDFDSRFSALRRHYEYRVTTRPGGPLPLRRIDTAAWRKPIDIDVVAACAEAFVGLHDFVALCKYKPHATTIRTVESFTWEDISTAREPQTYLARISADAFCWSMVRSLVGACLAVGEGRRGLDFAPRLLTLSQRCDEVPVAPACGLTLTGVDYPDDDQLAARAEATRKRRTADEVDRAGS